MGDKSRSCEHYEAMVIVLILPSCITLLHEGYFGVVYRPTVHSLFDV